MNPYEVRRVSVAFGHLAQAVGVPMKASGATAIAEAAIDDDEARSPGTGIDRTVSDGDHGDAADEGLTTAGTEARTVKCVAGHAEGAEDAVGSYDEVAPKDDEGLGDDVGADEGEENVNGEQYTVVDVEIAGKKAEKFRSGEEETDGCQMGERDVADVSVAADAMWEGDA
ncbi:hypothetical protein MTO96_016939 [Rhipicephalus appendiculatus]